MTLVDRLLPNALVVGAMKAGTSWLYQYLASRGDVCVPDGVKETFFFDRQYEKGPDWYAWHFRRFDPAKHLLKLEVAPSYFHCPDAPRRVAEVLGAPTLVVCLRDPVSRSCSHYLHLVRKGYTRQPLRDAVRRHPQIIEASRYGRVLPHWRDAVGGENLHLLLLEDLVADPTSFAEGACEALGLDYARVPVSSLEPENEAGVAPSFLVAACGRIVANALRARRLYWLVNLAKRMGLKRVFFGRGGGTARPRVSTEDREWLREQLAEEYGGLASSIGRAVPWAPSQPNGVT